MPDVGWRGTAVPGSLMLSAALLLLSSGFLPATSAFHEGTPVVLERTDEEGDAWAFAIRSHDEPTSYLGNELVVAASASGPYERSIASIGIIEIAEAEDGRLTDFLVGSIGTAFRGGDEMQIEPLGDQAGQTEFEQGDTATVGEKEGVIATAKERRFMEPGEWRYFVVWAGGSGSSTFQLRGEGFTVEKVVQGTAHVLGNDELVNGGGVHIQESARLPPGTSARDEGHVAAGATAISDTGVDLENQAPLMGMFNEYHVWDACTYAPFSGCIPVGVDLNAAASGLQDGGFANITMDTPIDGHVWDKTNFYFLGPGSGAGFGYGGGTVGTYGFNVESLTSAAGPSYRDPVWGQGARLDGEQLVLSLAEVDYTELETVDSTG